jgi:hypothetical protein
MKWSTRFTIVVSFGRVCGVQIYKLYIHTVCEVVCARTNEDGQLAVLSLWARFHISIHIHTCRISELPYHHERQHACDLIT